VLLVKLEKQMPEVIACEKACEEAAQANSLA
jgi:hypothetical protein